MIFQYFLKYRIYHINRENKLRILITVEELNKEIA